MPAATFAHLLDRLIDAGHGPSSTAATAGISTTPLFFLDFAPRPRLSAIIPQIVRPRKELTPLQRMAFDVLQKAGASLADDFSGSELKGAFRRLARELHPDMHPDATLERRTALALQFAEVRDAYEGLTSRA